VAAGAIAALFRVFSRKFPFWWGFLIAYGTIVMHIFLDLITSYGTQIFSPLTSRRYALPCVFIIDPLFTAFLLAALCASFGWKSKRTHFAVAGLVWIAIYPMANLGMGLGVRHYAEVQLNHEKIVHQNLHVSPDFLAPFRWKVIAEDSTSYHIGGINLLQPGKPLRLEPFHKADMNLLRTLGERASMFATYAWFSVYPIMERQKTADGSSVTFGDLRFYTTFLNRNAGFNNGRMPFSLTAFFNREGEFTEYSYMRPGRAKTIQHLE